MECQFGTPQLLIDVPRGLTKMCYGRSIRNFQVT